MTDIRKSGFIRPYQQKGYETRHAQIGAWPVVQNQLGHISHIYMTHRPTWWSGSGVWFVCIIIAGVVVNMTIPTPNTVGGGSAMMFIIIVLSVIFKATFQHFMSRWQMRRVSEEAKKETANSSNQNEKSSTENSTAFWEQVRQRRNLFFLWWIGWLPVGVILFGSYKLISGHDAPVPVANTLFYGYGAVWFWTAIRLKLLRCPKCHRRAIEHPFFIMRYAQCRHCGFSHKHV